MKLDLSICDKTCFGCIKGYKNKHDLSKGMGFDISCEGILDFNIKTLPIFKALPASELETVKGLLDPVQWAKENLDWHCLDPDGEVWKRKNPKEYYNWVQEHPGEDILGHSRYHRPYQAEMLRCTSKRKIFRLGRQCGKTEAMVVSMVYNLVNRPGLGPDEGFKIIIVTPYQAQIELIFKRLKQLISYSPVLQNEIKRNVKAPIYSLELYNGSEVKGFTAGTKSGGNAESVRGQSAHMLVFDEADYLSAGDMDAAMSVVTNHPDATVWMSSTPSGKRERFYDTCHDKLWKEFYYPSQVNPIWGDVQEKTFRSILTDIAYKHEVLAQFGEQEMGVFQNSYVMNAMKDFEYGDFERRKDWVYTIGVDWNSPKNGTTIAVLGYDTVWSKFHLVSMDKVSRQGWTQTEACLKIADLNRVWRPVSIYLDSGYGGMQYEVLRKFGFDAAVDKKRGPKHPDAALSRIVKQFEFGGKIEVRDLFTKQLVNKPAKPWLVENSVRFFERGDISIPKRDSELKAQLLGYIIKSINPSGTPIYAASEEKTGDHKLDSLMLSMAAFTLEQTPFGKVLFNPKIAVSGYFGEEGPTSADVKGNRPSSDRITNILDEESQLSRAGERPAANMSKKSSSIKLWYWEGFDHDAPRPRTRSLAEAEKEARQRTGTGSGKSGCRPKRKNI